MGVILKNPNNIPTFRWMIPIAGYRSNATATATAGRVYMALVEIPFPVVVDGIQNYNYATVAGNVTVGLYKAIVEDDPTGAVLIASSASTAMAGANAVQFIAFTSAVYLTPGRYYLAAEYSDGTATFGSSAISAPLIQNSLAYYNRGGGYGALTDPCPAITLLTAQNGYVLRVKA